MKRPICLLIVILTIACNSDKQSAKKLWEQQGESKSEKKDNPTSTNSDFVGQSFNLTTDFDIENCQAALNRCDCCTSQLVLSTETQFVYILGCEGSTYFTKGKYENRDSILSLTFDSVRVSYEYNWKAEVDSADDEYVTTVERLYLGITKYSIDSCKVGKLIYSVGKGEREYGLLDSTWSVFKLRALQDSEHWKLLNKK